MARRFLRCGKSEPEWMAEGRALIEDAVKSQLMADVPLGLYLSGGMDSSVLLLLAYRFTGKLIKTFTVTFDASSYDEAAWARKTAQYIPSEHTEVVFSKDDVEQYLEDIIAHFDEPLGCPTSIAKFFLSRQAAKEVKVVLTGPGGDELFGGYGAYRAAMLTSRLPPALKIPMRCLAHCIPDSLERTSFSRRLKAFLSHESHPFPHSYYSWRTAFDGRQRRHVGGIESFDEIERLFPHAVAPASWKDPLLRASYFDLFLYLEGEGLCETDRMAMVHSLETRCPFLDARLAEFAARLPSSLKMRHGVGKYIMRKMFSSELPPAVLSRGKYGFSLPIGHWLRGQLRGLFERYVFGNTTGRNRAMHPAVQSMWREHLAGRNDNGHRLWTIACYEIWTAKHFG